MAEKPEPKKKAKKAPKAKKAEKKTKEASEPKEKRVAGTKAQTQVPVAVMNGIKKLAKAKDMRPADVVRDALLIGLRKMGLDC